jgi:hypothetical protein
LNSRATAPTIGFELVIRIFEEFFIGTHLIFRKITKKHQRCNFIQKASRQVISEVSARKV